MAIPFRDVLLPEFKKHIVLPGETLASLAEANVMLPAKEKNIHIPLKKIVV